MAKYFAGTRALLACRGPGIFEWQTTVGSPTRFDASYVGGAIGVGRAIGGSGGGVVDTAYLQVPIGLDASSVTGTLWGHFECLLNTGNTTIGTANTNRWFSFVNTSGVTIAELVSATGANNSQFYFRYWNGSAFVQAGATVTLSSTARIQVDFRLVHGSGGSFDLWINNALVISVSGLNAAVNNTAFVRLQDGFFNSTGFTYYSQVALSDFDMRAYKFSSDILTGFGTYNEGTGTIGTMSDMGLSTAYILPANGNRVTGTIAARTLSAGQAIQSVQIGMVARVASPIANAQGLLRIASNDYASANISPAFSAGFGPGGAYWDLDPNSSAAWAIGSFNAAQFGAKAVT